MYRKIFGYHKWESVKTLICLLGRLDIKHILDQRKLLFYKRLDSSGNIVMVELYNRIIRSSEIITAQSKYKFCISWHKNEIKRAIRKSFQELCDTV